MGTTYCCINSFTSLEPSDWIALVAIAVNALLAIWIVSTIQNKLTNKRVLKDYFINEVKEIRNDYRTCLNKLYSDQADSKKIIPWFKLMNIKVSDLLIILNKKYKIDKNILSPYQNELRELITNNQEFITNYSSGNPIVFLDDSKSQIIIFQQKFNRLFSDIIVGINDFE